MHAFSSCPLGPGWESLQAIRSRLLYDGCAGYQLRGAEAIGGAASATSSELNKEISKLAENEKLSSFKSVCPTP